jgi:hypothetical protein
MFWILALAAVFLLGWIAEWAQHHWEPWRFTRDEPQVVRLASSRKLSSDGEPGSAW